MGISTYTLDFPNSRNASNVSSSWSENVSFSVSVVPSEVSIAGTMIVAELWTSLRMG